MRAPRTQASASLGWSGLLRIDCPDVEMRARDHHVVMEFQLLPFRAVLHYISFASGLSFD
jgi:hypothetical protein